MKKKFVIPLAVVGIILITALIMFSSLVSSKTIEAQLSIEQGTVLVNEKIVSGGMELKQGDVIETGTNGKATVVLYESIVINLEPETIITLDELIKSNPSVSQDGGETWNQVTNLFGIDSYTIKAGNSVAAVRGTSFYLTEEKIIVDKGEVDYEIDGQKFKVTAGRVVEKIGQEVRERDAKPDESVQLNSQNERTIVQLKNLRKLEVEKHPKTVNAVKKKYGITDEDIIKIFEDADRGELDLREFQDKSPVKVDSVEKIIRITEKIRELNQKGD
ncbi:MAG: FecR family protein [Nanoarchaeota archaeon]|nr:FecR family protein [Nanoarchaeota archaeon]